MVGSPGHQLADPDHQQWSPYNAQICAAGAERGIDAATAPNGGSARVVLYERRSRAVVIGDAFRSRLEAGLAAWAASMSATAICRPRAPPLGHELPADE